MDVDLGLPPVLPPDFLYHGTHARVVEVIQREGLKRMARRHVHLSADPRTATSVGARRGVPVVFRVDAARMVAEGFQFYQAANGVWLTDQVPAHYLTRE